ncbi:hypothetical protein D3C87_1653130 [compost metagenome]
MLVNDGKLNVALYNLKTDHLTRNNILTKEPLVAEQMEKSLKAFVQQYSNRMINNTLTAQ